MKRPNIKTVEVLQIGAGMAAALRWAIALMPLDGVRFALSDDQGFEFASFVMSLMFAVVEIGATAYIMRAWRAEDDKRTKSALMALWTIALVLMVFAQVPPILANVNGAPMTDYPFWFQAVWATCGVSIAFVIIGGVGYAEKSLEQKVDKADKSSKTDENLTQDSHPVGWQPAALTPQATASEDVPHDSHPLSPLTDRFVRAVWLAKKANAPFADVADEARQCLNGTSAALEAWLATGKQSLNELAALLGVAEESRGVFDATCRGLRKPTGAEIARK